MVISFVPKKVYYNGFRVDRKWDDADVLYYLTADGDLIATRGLHERFVSLRR